MKEKNKIGLITTNHYDMNQNTRSEELTYLQKNVKIFKENKII
jgi:hypothetical protein